MKSASNATKKAITPETASMKTCENAKSVSVDYTMNTVAPKPVMSVERLDISLASVLTVKTKGVKDAGIVAIPPAIVESSFGINKG